MAPRPRKPGNRDLPPNLYTTRVGYEYRHPVTKKRHGMGSDRRRAIDAAKILNAKLMPGADLVARVVGGDTVASVVERFRQEFLPEKEYSERTLSEIEYRLKRYERELGTRDWQGFTLEELYSWLKPLTRAAYIKHRSQWIDIYRFACSVGLSDRNLAEMTLVKQPGERKRKRWTWEQYEATRAEAEPWLQIAMDFALTSLQRREDLVTTRKKDDFVDGRLLVKQRKTGKRLAITPGGTLKEVIERAKALHPFCPYLIGRKPKRDIRGSKTHPYQVTPGMLTRAVAAARDAAAKKSPELFPGYEPGDMPTLHELRSFGAHLYQEAGYPDEYIQALLGHSDMKMTTHYLDGHKEEWAEVSADLTLSFR